MVICAISGSKKNDFLWPGTCSQWLDGRPSQYNYRGNTDSSMTFLTIDASTIYIALCVLVIIAHILTHLSLYFYGRYISLSVVQIQLCV